MKYASQKILKKIFIFENNTYLYSKLITYGRHVNRQIKFR